LRKASQALFVFGEIGRQEFERYFASQLCVFGQIDFTHAAFSEQLNDLVMADALAGGKFRIVVHEDSGCGFIFYRRCFQETARLFMRLDEQLNLTAEGVMTGARLIQKGLPLGRIDLQRRVKDIFNILPALRSHSVARTISL
jgi:hypothetical protein